MSHSWLDEVDDVAEDLIQRDQDDPNIMHGLSYLVGRVLEARYPKVPIVVDGEELGCGMVPGEAVQTIGEELTLFIANVLQHWLDAGSERDVTLEELGPVIEDHIKGWSTAAEGG